MNSVVDGLRQTRKGQLVYNRKLEGQPLTDLLHKCASVPALSSPHSEVTSPRPGQQGSLGLDHSQEGQAEEINCLGVQGDDHQYSKGVEDEGEKGEQDSLEKERSIQQKADSAQGPTASSLDKQRAVCSPRSTKVTCQRSPGDSPKSPQGVSPQSAPAASLVCSKVASPKHVQTDFIRSPETQKSPQSVQIASPKKSQAASQKYPEITSPRSPEALSPRRTVVAQGGSSPALRVRSPASQEGGVPSESPSAEYHNGQALNTSADNESIWQEATEDEGERTEESTHDLTVSFTEKLRAVTNVEMGYDNRSKELLEQKQRDFLQHHSQLESWQEGRVSEVQQQQHQDLSLLLDSIEKKQQSRRQAMQQAVQKVKDNHQHCSQRQDARLRHVELLSQQLQEEKAKREQALDQKLEEVRAVAHKITGIKTTLVSALDQCPHKQHLSEVADKTKLLVRKLSEQAEGLVGSLTRHGPLEEVLAKLKQFHEQSQNALDFVHNLTAEAERKAKAAAAEAEKQRQQAASAQAAQVGQGASAQPAVQPSAGSQQGAAGEEGALSAVAKEYESNAKLLSQTDALLDPFINDQQMKKTRFDLQRAVNTPVNAISPVSSGHLRDKLQRLRCLLKGERVSVLDRQVSARDVPQGLTFCYNLVAKMIVRKADEQVSSNHESAFAIAAVAVGLWGEFPEVGALLMAHLQALCPYVLPFYPPRLPNQSSDDYHKSLGYKVTNGTIEQQDKFLKRMSGILRLYAAILVTPPPQGAGHPHPHPHGLEHAWIWLTRSMNLQPNPDITATAIYDMLQVTGGFLLRAYRVQFVKLLYFLVKVFLPKLKEVAAGSGPVIRLETFLETTMRNNALIPEPEGYLSPRFWQT